MARHRQKDLEAGGEGLGVVETRKRLWEDVDGTVVKNRPWSATPEERYRKRARRVSTKQAQAEAQSETVIAGPSCQPQLSPPTQAQILPNPVPFNPDVPTFQDSWGLASPPSSCSDHFDFCQGSMADDVLVAPDG